MLESLQQYFTIQFTNGDLYLSCTAPFSSLVLLWMPRGVIPTVGDLSGTSLRPAVAPGAVRWSCRQSPPPGNPEDGDGADIDRRRRRRAGQFGAEVVTQV